MYRLRVHYTGRERLHTRKKSRRKKTNRSGYPPKVCGALALALSSRMQSTRNSDDLSRIRGRREVSSCQPAQIARIIRSSRYARKNLLRDGYHLGSLVSDTRPQSAFAGTQSERSYHVDAAAAPY